MICHCQPAPGCGPCTCPHRCAQCADDWIRALSECCHVAGELHAVREAGFTAAALGLPRNALALRLLMAFNGAPAHVVPPPGWRYFPNMGCANAWGRVAHAGLAGGEPLDLMRAWAPSVVFDDFRNEPCRKAWTRVHAVLQPMAAAA